MSAGGRYEQLLRIASGGMATVYVGRLRGAAGFSRLVAIKRAHPHVVEDPEFRRIVTEEARLASQLHHPNFVAIVDVDESDGELALIMDYVEGGTLAELLAAANQQNVVLPADVVVRIALDASAGLESVHSLSDDLGRPLRLVHRDVSPQNILIGVDGVARLSDLGVAKSLDASQGTESGVLKGKLGYMAPEYVEGHVIDARADILAMAVVVWEALTMSRLFRGSNDAETLRRIISYEPPHLSTLRPDLPAELDTLLRAGLSKHPSGRLPTASMFAAELERIARPRRLVASHLAVSVVVKHLLGKKLDERRNVLREKLGLPPIAVGEITREEVEPPTLVMGSDPFASSSGEGPTLVRSVESSPGVVAEPQPASALAAGVGATAADAEVSTLGRSGLVREPSAPFRQRQGSRKTTAAVLALGLVGAATAAIVFASMNREDDQRPVAQTNDASVADERASGTSSPSVEAAVSAQASAVVTSAEPPTDVSSTAAPSASSSPVAVEVAPSQILPRVIPKPPNPVPYPKPARSSHFPPPPD